MNMRRAWAILNRLDRAEIVLALAVRQEAAEALEVSVQFPAVGSLRVNVDTVFVDLPDLDNCVADRFFSEAENTASQVRHVANGWGDSVVNDQQVVVDVERQLIGIERTFCLVCRLSQKDALIPAYLFSCVERLHERKPWGKLRKRAYLGSDGFWFSAEHDSIEEAASEFEN